MAGTPHRTNIRMFEELCGDRAAKKKSSPRNYYVRQKGHEQIISRHIDSWRNELFREILENDDR